MNGLEGWQSTHHDLSPLDLRFRELAKDSEAFLGHDQFQSQDPTTQLLAYPVQPWPTFLGQDKLAELKRVGLGINRLLRSVPERVLQNDPGKLAEFYKLPSPALAGILFGQPTGIESLLSRGDLIDTASGFKCIEFNFTPSLGGWDTTIITRLQLAAPSTASFLQSESLRIVYTDPMFELFRHMLEEVRRKDILRGKQVTLVFLPGPQEAVMIGQYLGYFTSEMQSTIDRLGYDLEGKVFSCTQNQLSRKGSSLFLDDHQKIDAVIDLGAFCTPEVYRMFKGDLVALYNGPLGNILSEKRNLALLSQHASSGQYSPEERSFIEAHLPWTRLVVSGPADYQGETHSVVELLRDNQDLFVLKDSDSCGGKGVVLGKFVSREEWSQALDKALAEGDWVVQEIQESLPYLYQSGDHGCSVHDMIWGPFVFGDLYAGVVLRMQPKSSQGAVNLSRHATEGIVLEV